MNNNLRLAALIALALGASTAEAAKFYKWTDAQGATHYTVEPPPAGAKASEVRVKTSSVTDAEEAAPAPASATKPAKASTAPSKPKDGKDKTATKDQKSDQPAGPEQYAERCKGLRANLQAMEEHARVKETDAKGEVRVLSEDEKNARLDDTRRQIKAFCE